MSTDDLMTFAKAKVAERASIKGRATSAVYRRFFPAAEVFHEQGWSVSEMATAFVEGGKWPKDKEDALRQALSRHFRAEARKEAKGHESRATSEEKDSDSARQRSHP
jgi:hypothetical protein